MSVDNNEEVVVMSEDQLARAQSCIGRATKYPFDNRKPEDRSHLVAQAVLADLTDRSGIRQALEACDDGVKTEIVDSLSAIVRIVTDPKVGPTVEPLGTYRFTERGFQVAEFTDGYGVSSSLQESSAGDGQHLWLGPNNGDPVILASDARRLGLLPANDTTTGWVPYAIPKEVLLKTRMHLSREQVQGLVARLTNWLETRSLKLSDE